LKIPKVKQKLKSLVTAKRTQRKSKQKQSGCLPDEDIPTTQPSPPTVDDPIVAACDKSNDEIRIGPIT
jgi:hypothetical protein